MDAKRIIFSVGSIADLGVDAITLDEAGYFHIVEGHRDLRSFVMGIEEAVKNPTQVYRSSYNMKRYQFLAQHVTTKRGHPMNVIVEIEGVLGKVITASPKKSVNGTIVWDHVTGLYVTYDEKADVLYVSHGGARTAYADDDPQDSRIWLRFFEEDDSPSGVTIFEAASVWSEKQKGLAAQISTFLNVLQSDVEGRINDLMR